MALETSSETWIRKGDSVCSSVYTPRLNRITDLQATQHPHMHSHTEFCNTSAYSPLQPACCLGSASLDAEKRAAQGGAA